MPARPREFSTVVELKADAVVDDDGSHELLFDRHLHFRSAGPGVAYDVGQALLHDPVDDGLDLGLQMAVILHGR